MIRGELGQRISCRVICCVYVLSVVIGATSITAREINLLRNDEDRAKKLGFLLVLLRGKGGMSPINIPIKPPRVNTTDGVNGGGEGARGVGVEKGSETVVRNPIRFHGVIMVIIYYFSSESTGRPCRPFMHSCGMPRSPCHGKVFTPTF